jgi:hypothetical protein
MWSPTDFPAASGSARVMARRRLRVAMASEGRRRRRERDWKRGAVVVAAVMAMLVAAPMGTGGLSGPLLGLADAVAAMPPPVDAPGRHWSARTETRELMAVPLADGRTLEFLATAIEESWHDSGDVPRRVRTYGSPMFFSSEDEDAFRAAGLASLYGAGSRVTVPLPAADLRFLGPLDGADQDQIAGTLRRRIAGLGDRRMEEVHLLRLTADLILLHADDPAMRAQVLRVIADIPGIVVVPNARRVVVSIDYLDGDRPLRLMYEFDADTAHLVGEYLAALATQTEPVTVLRSARHTLPVTPNATGS